MLQFNYRSKGVTLFLRFILYSVEQSIQSFRVCSSLCGGELAGRKKNSLCALTIFHKNGRRILKVYSFSVHETGSD